MEVKTEKMPRMHICSLCQKLIEGPAVKIQARGRKPAYIHPECIKAENEKNRRDHEAAAAKEK